MGVRDAGRNRYDGFDLEHLYCYGCGHSAAGEPWPGGPSGERPCGFCIRNPLQHLSDPKHHRWYDQSEPVSVPMDCYSTLDMKSQVAVWIETAKTEDTEALGRAVETQRKLQSLPKKTT